MQEAFREHHGLQCGFCTPRHDHDRRRLGPPQGPRPLRDTIREELEGQSLSLHRLQNIVQSIAAGAKAIGEIRLA